jgi:ABC-type branched-subunit amino acid transport system substrate-binding protein
LFSTRQNLVIVKIYNFSNKDLIMVTRSLFLLLLLLLSAHPPTLAQDDASACNPADGTPVRIGAIFAQDDLFGVAAGNPYRGVQAIVAAVNACGGVNGQPVELVYIAANNREQAQEAVAQLPDDISLVIGSGSLAVSEVLSNAASEQSFIYWEVTESLGAVRLATAG